MYGRCETDPFDQATDVCDSCYGEFCSTCLVQTRGRKHPICRECAVIASGLRPGAKPLLRGSKKTARDRRQVLREAPVASATFEYFDDRAPEATGDADDAPIPNEPGTFERPPAEPEAQAVPAALAAPKAAPVDEPTPEEARFPFRGAVNADLAALAKQEADRRAPTVAPESVPAPAWLTGGADDESPTEIPSASEVEAEAEHRRRKDDKPVTDGFEWVSELPKRGSTTPLPSQSDDSSTQPEDGNGAVATVHRPSVALPRRRSKLRQDDTR